MTATLPETGAGTDANANTWPLRIVLTGATGFVGEGVLLECLADPGVAEVLLLTRRPYAGTHPRLTQCVVPDFFTLDVVEDRLAGYDACFYCAGISSVGMDEAAYRRITLDATLHVARVLARLNPQLVFCHVSGRQVQALATVMWARVKWQAETALNALPLPRVCHLRPGFMRPVPGQRNLNLAYRVLGPLYPLLHALWPAQTGTLREVALTMLARARGGPARQALEVDGIRALAAGVAA
jgi:uncharacterized protein YbjT (DUF2867 family)